MTGVAIPLSQNFTYVPDPNFFGSDQIVYMASDGSLNSSIGIITLIVYPVDGKSVLRTPACDSL
jgi:hypothetical protein